MVMSTNPLSLPCVLLSTYYNLIKCQLWQEKEKSTQWSVFCVPKFDQSFMFKSNHLKTERLFVGKETYKKIIPYIDIALWVFI